MVKFGDTMYAIFLMKFILLHKLELEQHLIITDKHTAEDIRRKEKELYYTST